jgi:4-amino-4-deoxy-L-arabinose transferase-like glycosyltransferase
LVPLLARAETAMFGDNLWALRLLPALCAGVVVVLGGMIAAELGGGRRAQLLTVLGFGSSTLVLTIGHLMVTDTPDLVAWCAVLLFALRALLRGDGRWWLAAGAACGVALYFKYIVLLLPASLLAGLLLAGPRAPFRDRRLYLGMALTLIIGAPNLIYQALNGFPQIQMAGALSRLDGLFNRILFVPSLPLLLGLGLTPIWVAGLVALLRRPQWRQVRALGLGSLIAMLMIVLSGGRSDYIGGYLLGLFAAGCVVVDGWIDRKKRRQLLVAAVLALTALIQIPEALPIIPQISLASWNIDDVPRDSVGWPVLVRQIAGAYQDLPAAERSHAVVLSLDYAVAGAVYRFGSTYQLPKAFSGQNQLYAWGPPPATANVVIAIGFSEDRLDQDFSRCQVVAHVDNGLHVESLEQGQPISVCHGLRAPWAQLWPSYRYLGHPVYRYH